MWNPRWLGAYSALVFSLWLTHLALAQAPVDISHEVLTILEVPNASGVYGHSILNDRNMHGRTVGGFAGGGALPEGSFFVTLTPTGVQAKLFSCGPDVHWTMAKAVNRHGAIVGWCYVREGDNESVHGFYRSESGNVTRLRYPGARYTEATDVNDNHVVTCWYEDQHRVIHGCRWTRSTGKFEQLDAPFPGTVATIPTAINTQGHILATILATPANIGGLLKQGHWTAITIPGAQTTHPEDLTDQGAILGFVDIPGQYTGNFLFEQGVTVVVQAVLPQSDQSSAVALSPQRQVIGAVSINIPPSNPDTGDWIHADQGFIAPLPAVLGAPLTPPGPQRGPE